MPQPAFLQGLISDLASILSPSSGSEFFEFEDFRLDTHLIKNRLDNLMSAKPQANSLSRTHRRQFVFSDASISIPAGWHSINLGSFHLHYCPWLKVTTVVDASGQQWALLGHAFQVNAASPHDPAASIARSASSDVPALVCTWAGRWLLLSCSTVITDAASLLGTYILENDESVLISGSLALLSQLVPSSVRDPRVLGWYGLNWFPGPLSKLSGVRKLLPDQIYNPATREVNFFDRLTAVRAGTDLRDAAGEISAGIARVFRSMVQQEGHNSIILALTGGLDSRTTFSVLQSSGVPFSTLTLEHPRISKADITLPARISTSYGITHRYVPSNKLLRDRLEEYDLHIHGCVIDGDRELYARGSFDGLDSRSWLIRSGCWEIGRKYFYRKLSGLDLEEIVDRPGRLMARFNNYFRNEASANSLREWARWRLKHAIAVPWQDLFYRDQRLGCWSAAIEQSLDLLNPVSIHPVNCDHFYGIMLGLDEISDTDGASLQHEIIAQCVPDLAQIPVNPPDGHYFALKNRLLKIAAILAGESENLMRSLRHK
jgi:hypothetical protein